jgi:flavin-dependent dehydrogenase
MIAAYEKSGVADAENFYYADAEEFGMFTGDAESGAASAKQIGAATADEEFDTLVVGAGLAGLQCARLLGRAGRRVLLVDQKRSPDQAVHTTGILVRRTLEDFPLPEDCLGPAVRHVTLYSPARRRLELASSHDEFRVGRMGRLYGRMLAECRATGVVWSPSTRYLWSEAAAAFASDGVKAGSLGVAGGTCVARSLVLLERGGRAFAVRARFVVGADGARSRVARDLGLDENREWIVGVEDVFTGAHAEGPPRFHCFLDPRVAPGYLAWVVSDGEETHVGVGGYAARFDPARALEIFRDGLGGIIDLGGARRVERRGGRIPVGGVLERIVCARGLLVGDAAGAVSPLTAGGLDPCLRLSTLAARVADDYISTGDSSALAPYSGHSFRARFASRLWMRRLIGGVRTPLLAEAACAALRLPPFDRLARHVFFGRGSFPDVRDDGERLLTREVASP